MTCKTLSISYNPISYIWIDLARNYDEAIELIISFNSQKTKKQRESVTFKVAYFSQSAQISRQKQQLHTTNIACKTQQNAMSDVETKLPMLSLQFNHSISSKRISVRIWLLCRPNTQLLINFIRKDKRKQQPPEEKK